MSQGKALEGCQGDCDVSGSLVHVHQDVTTRLDKEAKREVGICGWRTKAPRQSSEGGLVRGCSTIGRCRLIATTLHFHRCLGFGMARAELVLCSI